MNQSCAVESKPSCHNEQPQLGHQPWPGGELQPPYLVTRGVGKVCLQGRMWLHEQLQLHSEAANVTHIMFQQDRLNPVSPSWHRPLLLLTGRSWGRGCIEIIVWSLNPARLCISEGWLAWSCGWLITDRKWIRVASKAQERSSKQEVIAEPPLNHRNRW